MTTRGGRTPQYCDPVETIAHLYTGCDVINIFWDDISANISFMPRLEKLHGHISIIENFMFINKSDQGTFTPVGAQGGGGFLGTQP